MKSRILLVTLPNDKGDLLKNRLLFLVSQMDECKNTNLKGHRVSCFKGKVRDQLIVTAAKGILLNAVNAAVPALVNRIISPK